MDALNGVVVLGILLPFAQAFLRLFLTNRLSLVVISIYLLRQPGNLTNSDLNTSY